MQRVSNLIVFSCDATISLNGSVRSQRCVRIGGVIGGVAVTAYFPANSPASNDKNITLFIARTSLGFVLRRPLTHLRPARTVVQNVMNGVSPGDS